MHQKLYFRKLLWRFPFECPAVNSPLAAILYFTTTFTGLIQAEKIFYTYNTALEFSVYLQQNVDQDNCNKTYLTKT